MTSVTKSQSTIELLDPALLANFRLIFSQDSQFIKVQIQVLRCGGVSGFHFVNVDKATQPNIIVAVHYTLPKASWARALKAASSSSFRKIYHRARKWPVHVF